MPRSRKTDPNAIAVIEAALLIEAGYHKKLDCLVVTWCTPEQQLARLTKSASGPRDDARAKHSSASRRKCPSKKSAAWR